MKMEHDTEKLCEMKKTLMCWSEAEIAKGQYGENHCDAEALGEVIDMIKDLAEAEEKCVKACYYKCLIKKLHDGDFDEDDEWEDVEEMNERYGTRSCKPYHTQRDVQRLIAQEICQIYRTEIEIIAKLAIWKTKRHYSSQN